MNAQRLALAACLFVVLTVEAGAQSRDILYGARGGGNLTDLYILNPLDGSVVVDLGPTGFSISGLRFDPTTGVLYGSTTNFGGSVSKSLIRLNPATGTGTLVGSLGVPNHSAADIAFTRSGQLYGWLEPSQDDLYLINKSTGQATKVGESGLGTFGSGLAANSHDVLYFTGNGANGALRIVDKTTGLTTVVATMSGAPLPTRAINALAFNNHDVLYGVNGGDVGSSSPTHLVTIDTTTGVVTDLGPSLTSLDAIAFLFANDPEEFSAIFQIGFANATTQALNLERRMDAIREGANLCPPSIEVSGADTKDYSGGKTHSDGKVALLPTGPEPSAAAISATQDKWGFFLMGTGQFIDVNRDDDAAIARPGYDITSGGFTLGADYRVCSNFAIGLFGGYARSRAEFDDQLFSLGDGDLTVDSGTAGLYATWFSHGFYVQGAVDGSYNNYDTHRADILGFEDGSTDGWQFDTFINAGYDFHWRCFVFGPIASLQYTNIDINGFTEEDSSILALDFPDQSQDSLRSTLGLRFSSDWKLWGKVILRTQSRAVWRHEFYDTSYGIASRFALRALGTNILSVDGPETGRDSAILSSGFALLWNERISTYANVDTEYGRDNFDNFSATAGVRVNF